jgi:hypothetical protein
MISYGLVLWCILSLVSDAIGLHPCDHPLEHFNLITIAREAFCYHRMSEEMIMLNLLNPPQ